MSDKTLLSILANLNNSLIDAHEALDTVKHTITPGLIKRLQLAIEHAHSVTLQVIEEADL